MRLVNSFNNRKADTIHMCNLSQGVSQRGMEIGIEQGELKKAVEMAKKLITRHATANDIMDLTGLSLEVVRDLISERKNFV